MASETRMAEIVPAVHMKGMVLKNLIARHKLRRRDAGIGVIDAVAGIALAAIIVGGPILYFSTVNESAAANASTQGQNTAISEALDRAAANIQAADSIVHAGPNELVTRSTEVEEGKTDNPVITRWVVDGTTLYRQTWSGTGTGPTQAGGYDRTKPVTDTSLTGTVVADLKLDAQLFTYTDKDGSDIDVKAPADALTETGRTAPADGKRTFDIALVNLALKAGTTVKGSDKTGIVENKTSVAPRSVSGKAGPAIDTPMCPAVTIGTNAAGKPVITWSTLPGYTSYQVTRNGAQVAVVTATGSDTQKSWTDAGATPGPAESIQYRVHARNADGSIASIACMPKVWSAQIAAPAFKNSGVLPAADQAHEWTGGPDGALGLKKPRIVLSWGAVPGASNYDLKYRELDPATGNPLTPGFSSAAAGLPAATTTFTWDEGGWASSYEWFIKANAGAGQGQSAESAHITTLTHPPAPQNVNVTPEYGTGAARLSTGINVITWDAAPTAVEYDIWRYNSGSAGAVTKLGTVKASAARTYSDAVPYGTTHTYYVAAVNDGPRGNTNGKASSANPEAGVTSATGVMPTVSYREPAGGTVMSTMAFDGGNTVTFERAAAVTPGEPAPKRVSQLQYPPVPVPVPVSDDPAKTRDLDGVNQIVWNPTLSAQSYLVARSTPMTDARTCLAGDCFVKATGGVTETIYKDTNRPKGSQFDYYVKAVNPTGPSVEFSADVRLTQRPETPVLNVTDRPDLVSADATFTTTANADSGNDGANKFCTADTCKYELTLNGQMVFRQDHPAAGSGSTVPLRAIQNEEGTTLTFGARAKNEARTQGGYSDPASTSVDTYPGKFDTNQWLGDTSGNGRERFVATLTSTDAAGSSSVVGAIGKTTVAWGTSAGATSITATRTAVRNDATSWDSSLGLPGGGPESTTVPGHWGTYTGWAAPGATYRHEVVATGRNGLKRPMTTGEIITPADVPHHAKIIITCSNNTYTNQTTANYDHPNHIVGARLVDMNKAPLYGAWGGTSVWGLEKYKGYNDFQWSNGVWLNKAAANANVNAGPGIGYYQGVTSGFDIQNAGDGGPSSAKIRISLPALATFNSGCGPYGGTWDDLKEPSWPCYGYIEGVPCKAVNNENRPQWTSK